MAILGRDTTITWVGHGTFRITTPSGKKIMLDAWVDGNPACPDDLKQQIRSEGVDAILLSHGHFDHIADLVSLAKDTGAQVACIFDMVGWLGKQGIAEDKLVGFNKGGTVEVAGVKATMTSAQHSSTYEDNGVLMPMGEPVGYVMEFENGFVVYYTGDTAVSADMQIIGDLYKPDVVILPIGDHFTMGPRQAGYALKLIGAKYAVPGHFGTFPILKGTPEELEHYAKESGASTEVIALKPGESVS